MVQCSNIWFIFSIRSSGVGKKKNGVESSRHTADKITLARFPEKKRGSSCMNLNIILKPPNTLQGKL